MKPSLFICLFSALFFGCSSFKKYFEDENKILNLENYKQNTEDSYYSQLATFADYLDIKIKNRKISLSKKSRLFLNNVYRKIYLGNENLLGKEGNPKFVIFKDSRPIILSFPQYHFFISSGLLKKYVKEEGILTAILATEILRSHKGVYKRRELIPLGFIDISNALSLMKLDLEERAELDKWSYYLLRRSNLRFESYLSWLQVQNRNAIDFAFLYGNIKEISLKEFSFKKFLISQKFPLSNSVLSENSSNDFYSFINEVRRVEY